jgi:catechol 2,3-dioxygenase-like lactoylglutathione lyase family enzyme
VSRGRGEADPAPIRCVGLGYATPHRHRGRRCTWLHARVGTGYCPHDWQGAQLFLYPTLEDGTYSRHRIGLQHIAFLVPTRADVHRVHEWVSNRGDEVLHAPRPFPEYGQHCYATFFLDPHGFMLEVVCHKAEEATTS